MIPGEVLHLLTTGAPWRQELPRGVRPMGWTRQGGRGLWRPVYAVQGGSELAVLRPTVVATLDTSAELGLSSVDLWTHSDSVIVGVGGAGQFSGHGHTYEADQQANALTRLQIVYLRLTGSVAALLRLYYHDVNIFGAQGDLTRLTSAETSNTGAPAGQDWGFQGWSSQTNLPDTLNPPDHGAANRRMLIRNIAANTPYEWALTGIPLLTRNLTVGNQLEAITWGLWAAATVTGITVDSTVIIRKLPV